MDKNYDFKLGIIGVGKMGNALLDGIIDSGFFHPQEISVYDINSNIIDEISDKANVGILPIDEMPEHCNTLLIAVKPQQLVDILPKLSRVTDKNLIISILAGTKTSRYENILGNIPVIRAMPNTPALLRQGITVLSKGKYALDNDLALAENIFKSVGKVTVLDENLQDIVVAISGSGPAYFFLFCEYLIDAAVDLGLKKSTAELLVIETITGAAKMLKETNMSSLELRQMVTSKGGTTQAATQIFNQNKLQKIFFDAVASAKKRSEELSL